MPRKMIVTRSFLGVVLLLTTAAHVYADAPRINSISPNRGPVVGATLVTISGTSFNGATSVTFDGVAGTSLTVVNDTTITVRTPGHAAGIAAVEVTTPEGSDKVNEGFGYGSIPVSLDDSRGLEPGSSREGALHHDRRVRPVGSHSRF